MPDIFISYSRKDSTQALELAEKLRASGMEIWIDKRGIEGAERWATEIVEGIRACSTFIVLLSPNSVASEHVLRELTIALEKRKRVLPVKLQPTELPSSFEYPLAGLQRVAISDFEGILRAHQHGVERVSVKDTRKSLMILPLEDLSPASEDNAWFADGLTGELISALSNIKSLRIPDRKTSMDLKGFRGKTAEIARELDIRYFIEGNVRKFGDQIKISVELLDIDTGDYLWQHSYRGEFKDIFDMQEAVAKEVVIGLKLHLTKDEEEKVKDRGTENAEAYELFVRASEYYSSMTKQSIQIALELLTEAIRLDPNYALAYECKAETLVQLYHAYNRDPQLLQEAEACCRESQRLKPDLFNVYFPLSQICSYRGKLEEAEELAKEFILKDPQNDHSYFSLAYLYDSMGQFAKAIAPYEEALRLKPDDLSALQNVVAACSDAGETEKCEYWATIAVAAHTRYLRLHPEDEAKKVWLALLLFWSGRKEEAQAEAMKLTNLRDGNSLYNVACLFGKLGDKQAALRMFRKAIEAGMRSTNLLKDFLNDENEGVVSLRGTTEYEEVKKMVEKIEIEHA